MIARYSGACLGLLAFTVTVVAGLNVENPVTVILSRSILALIVFCVIGLVVGGAAQLVVAEHEKKRESEIRERFHEEPPGAEEAGSENKSPVDEAASIGT